MEQEQFKIIVEKGEKKFILQGPADATLGDLYDVIMQYYTYTSDRMRELGAQKESPKEEEKNGI